MKRLIMVVMMMLAMTASCYAASWEWVGSNDKNGIFYDKDSIIFEMSSKTQTVNRDRVVVWEKMIYDEAFVQKRFDLKNIKL